MEYTGRRWISRTVRNYLKARNGNIAITFALCAVPLLVAFGVAIDYARQVNLKTQFDSIADAVALQAVDVAAMSLTAAKAKAAATSQFTVLAAANGSGSVDALTITLSADATGRVATVSYTVSVPPSITGMLGFKKLSVSGSATAHASSGGYLDIYVLADNTPSMGLGATNNDIENLENLTTFAFGASDFKGRCAFACHRTGSTYDYYTIARANGINLRIDIVRNAINSLLDTAKAAASDFAIFRFSMYTFGADATTRGLTNIFPLSSDIDGAKSATSAIDLMSTPYAGYAADALTNFPGVMFPMNDAIPDSGDGMSQATSRKLLVLISDGTDDRMAAHCYTPFYIAYRCVDQLYTNQLCNNIKARGITIFSIYTTYLPIPGDLTYLISMDQINQGPFSPSPNSKIAAAMKACASPGYFQEVGPDDSISATLNKLFNQFLEANTRITG